MLRKKIKIMLLILIVLLSIHAIASAQIDSTEIQRARVNLILNRFHWRPIQLIGGYGISVDGNGRLTSINGRDMDIGLTVSNPVERFYQFCERYSDLFDFINIRQEMILERGDTINVNGGPDQITINFRQVESGVDVLEGFGGAMLSSDSGQFRLSSISFIFYPEARNINTTPTISMERAKEIALSDPVHNGLTPGIYVIPELLIKKFDDGFHLAWKVAVMGGGFNGFAQFWIDAHTGAILFAGSSVIMDP